MGTNENGYVKKSKKRIFRGRKPEVKTAVGRYLFVYGGKFTTMTGGKIL